MFLSVYTIYVDLEYLGISHVSFHVTLVRTYQFNMPV